MQAAARWERRGAVAVGCALVTLASGCAHPVDDSPPPPAQIHAAWPGCVRLGAFKEYISSPPDLGAGGVPADFTPATAVLCAIAQPDANQPDANQPDASTPRPRTPEPDSTAGLERRATRAADLTELEAYLKLPSQRSSRPSSLACPAIGWIAPWLFLLDAKGRWIQPKLPVDQCGLPRNMLSSEDQRLPYSTMRFDDTVVCRSKVGADWNCRPV